MECLHKHLKYAVVPRPHMWRMTLRSGFLRFPWLWTEPLMPSSQSYSAKWGTTSPTWDLKRQLSKMTSQPLAKFHFKGIKENDWKNQNWSFISLEKIIGVLRDLSLPLTVKTGSEAGNTNTVQSKEKRTPAFLQKDRGEKTASRRSQRQTCRHVTPNFHPERCWG